jgi:type II secretory pathway pseudopilin PulG
MNASSNQARKKKNAYALLLTLAFLAVILIAMTSTMTWIVSNSANTARNNQFVSSEYAAEAATEGVLSKMEGDWLAGTLATNGATYATVLPTNMTEWPVP